MFAVWRPVIISEQDSRSLPDVELLQRLVAVTDSAQCWAVILSKGGHFSAAVFDLRPVPPSQHSKAHAPLFKELAHKSYHRYVVRYAASLCCWTPPPSAPRLLSACGVIVLLFAILLWSLDSESCNHVWTCSGIHRFSRH